MDDEIPGTADGAAAALPAAETPPLPPPLPHVPPVGFPLGLRVLAGLETGIAGGLVMLLWFVADSWLHREYLWKVPHLFAATFYGDRIFRASFGVITLAGIALHLCAAGTVGILFGCIVTRPPQVMRLTIAALIASMSWYWFNQAVVWRHWALLVPLYVTPGSMVAAHVLYGLSLARYARNLRQLRQAFQPRSVLE